MVMSQGVHVIPWKVLGPGDDNSESINTLKSLLPLMYISSLQFNCHSR